MSRRPSGPRLRPYSEPGYRAPIYRIEWTEGGRTRRRSTGESDLGRAEAAFTAWLQERGAGRERRGDPAEVHVTDILDAYQRERGPETAAPATLAYACDPLRHFFARDVIADLTAERVKAYWAWRRVYSVATEDDERQHIVTGGAKDGTIIRELAGTLRPAIQHAINRKRLSPGVYHIPVPQRPAGRQAWITRSEAARLLRETRRDRRARLHLPLYALLALYTGQRRGAILELGWTQVDLLRGRIDFNPPGRPRTKKRRAIIPVPRSLLAALRRAHKRAAAPTVLAYRGASVGDVKKGFNSAAARAGLPHVTSHTLRHTAGTWMAQRGVPLREIAGYLGHSDARTTELYAHHHPDYLRTAREAFE